MLSNRQVYFRQMYAEMDMLDHEYTLLTKKHHMIVKGMSKNQKEYFKVLNSYYLGLLSIDPVCFTQQKLIEIEVYWITKILKEESKELYWIPKTKIFKEEPRV